MSEEEKEEKEEEKYKPEIREIKVITKIVNA